MCRLSIDSIKKPLILFSFVLLLTIVITGPLHTAVAELLTPSNVPNEKFIIADGPVNASATASDGTVYFGGDFTYVGPNTGSGVSLSASTGQLPAKFPKINGAVNSAVSDGSGGWFIGGDFTKVDGLTRNRLAHILSDGSVDQNWRPSSDGVVLCMALNSAKTILYIGGDFGLISGKARNYSASINVKPAYDRSGNIVDNYATVQSWNPNTDDIVKAIAVNGTNIYIGGSFTMVGPNYRDNLAVVDSSAGKVRYYWVPDPNGEVNALFITGSGTTGTLYIGGAFTEFFTNVLDPTPVNYLAAVSTRVDTVSLKSWYPEPGDTVNDIAVYNGNVYIGGEFTSIGAADRNYLGSVSVSTGNVTSWAPDANGIVNSVDASAQGIFVGGDFTKVGLIKESNAWIGGTDRRRFAAFSASGALASWTADAGDIVRVVALGGTNVFAGGDFNSIKGTSRNRLAAVSATGSLLSWAPNVADGSVNALAVDSAKNVYVGGTFTSVEGSLRNNLASVNSSGALLPWGLNTDGAVNAIALDGTKIYIGGDFTKVGLTWDELSKALVGGDDRSRLAVINTSSELDSWAPDPSGAVNAIAVDANSNVYVGGAFTAAGGSARNRLASFTSLGALRSWNPNVANGMVNTLAVGGSTIYIGGNFTSVGGQSRNMLAAASTSGSLLLWNPNATGGLVNSLEVDGSNIYAGGKFTAVKSLTRNRLALITASGTVKDWNPSANNTIKTIAKNDKFIMAGGLFNKVAGQEVEYLSRIDFDTTGPVLKFASTAKLQGNHIKGKTIFPMVVTDAGTGVNKVEVYYGTTRLAVRTASPYNITVDTSKVANGKRTFTVKAYDKAGNSKQITRYYIVDNTLPVVNSLTLSPLVPSPATYASAYYKVSDNLAPYVYVTLQIRKGTSTVSSQSLGAKTKGTVHKQLLKMPSAAGAYTLRIITADYAGNQQIKDLNFTIK